MDDVLQSPSLPQRQLLNFLTGAVMAATAGSALYPVSQFLIPPKEVTQGSGTFAKDRLSNPITASQLLVEPAGTRALIAGLAGEPTYLTVKDSHTLEEIGIVNNCTPLGCTFPWNSVDQQFQCPCHGSR